MTSSFTANKRLQQPALNDYVDTWDQPVNANMDLIDLALGGGFGYAVSSLDIYVTDDQSKFLQYKITGSLINNVVIVFPARGSFYIINNQVSLNGYVLLVKTSASGSVGVELRNGRSLIYSDGVDIFLADDANGSFPPGTRMPFHQQIAPTGWTKVTGFEDLFLRFVDGNSGGTRTNGVAGVSSFGGNVTGGRALSVGQLPSHTHGVNDPSHSHQMPFGANATSSFSAGPIGSVQAPGTPNTYNSFTGISIQNTGNGDAHDHPLPSLYYTDLILAVKN